MPISNAANTTLNQFFYDGNVCPECKTGFKLVYGGSQYYGCPQCRSYLDIRTKGSFKKIIASPKKIPSSLPLGSKGEINGTSYEVIGYTSCREVKSIYSWKEYYLYNRSKGFAYLSEYAGNWIFLYEPSTQPVVNFKYKSLEHEDREYRLYNTYRSELLYIEGEFDHNLLEGNKPGMYEYIHPPYLLSCERNGNTALNWLQGEHIDHDEIKRIFSVNSLPTKNGVGMVEPFKYKTKILWKVALLGIAALLLIHLAIFSIKPSYTKVFDQTYSLPDTSGTLPPIVSPAFTLNPGIINTDNLEIQIEAPVNNSWMEAQISLINDYTGEEFNFETGVEYYHGSDWSEGSQSKTITLSAIPAGTYHLNIFPIKENLIPTPYFRLQLTRGVEMWSNLIIIILIMLVFPTFMYYRYTTMEKERWSNSDYGE